MANKVNVSLDMNVQGYVQGIDKATESTQKYETETRKISDATGNFRKDLAAAKKEVMNLAQAYNKLDKEAKNSAFGKEMARQLEEAKQKAAEYIDLQGDLNTELKNMASDTAVFDTLSDGLSGLGSTMSAVTGVMGIFTDDTEMMTKAVTYFTTAESIASAAIKVKNLLQKQSSLMIGIRTLQTKAATMAENLNTGATAANTAAVTASTAATKSATVAQAAFNAVAKANPYVLLAAAVLGLVGAFGLFSLGLDENTTSINSNTQAANDMHQELMQMATSMALTNNAIKAYNMLGKTQKEIDDAKIEGYEHTITELQQFIAAEKQAQTVLTEGGAAWQQSVQDLADYERQLRSTQQALQDFKQELQFTQAASDNIQANWNNFKTPKEINAAISEFRRLRDETELGSDAYNDYTRKIDALQKKLNPRRGGGGGGNSNNNKDYIPTATNSIQDLENQISKLQEKAKKGALPPELQDPQKYAAKLKDLQKQLKNLKIQWQFEKPETKLQQLEQAVNDAKEKFILAVDANDKQAQYEALEAYYAAQRTLDNYKLSIEIEPQIDPTVLAKQAREISKIASDALSNKKEASASYDFSELPKEFSKYANEVVSQMQKIEDARKQLTDIMNADDATDTQIAASQEGLEQLNTAYEQLREQANVYQELSDAADKLRNHNEKVIDTIASIGDAVQGAADLFAAFGEETDDNSIKAVGIVAQAVATVALSFAQALTTCKTWVDWLAFGLTGMATMVSMVTQIKSLSEAHAGGGIVGGSSYAGDRILTSLNSGEMVLNKRQQQNLFNMLDTDTFPQHGGTNITVTGVIRGTDLLLVQKNTSKVMKKAGNTINF